LESNAAFTIDEQNYTKAQVVQFIKKVKEEYQNKYNQYIEKIKSEYQTLYNQYRDLENKYNSAVSAKNTADSNSEYYQQAINDKNRAEQATSELNKHNAYLENEINALKNENKQLKSQAEMLKSENIHLKRQPVREESENSPDKNIIAQVLIDAEVTAKQVISRAEIEAFQIMKKAKEENTRLMKEQEGIVVELKGLQNKINTVLNDRSGYWNIAE